VKEGEKKVSSKIRSSIHSSKYFALSFLVHVYQVGLMLYHFEKFDQEKRRFSLTDAFMDFYRQPFLA
jgi:hypothetical protein